MRGILVRIAADSVYGRWHCPVDPRSNRFVYVPIWDKKEKRYRPGLARSFQELAPALKRFNLACNLSSADAVRLPEHLGKRWMHLDPDFKYLTYGDQGEKRASEIRCLLPGDFLAFYSGLRPVRPCKHKLVYALVGLFVVDKIKYAVDLPRKHWHRNAHTRWTVTSPDDIVVFAKPGVSGRLERCIPIAELRKKAYRVRKDLLQAWGGLSVRNGYLQRSAVPPTFREANRFYRWFRKQGVPLTARND